MQDVPVDDKLASRSARHASHILEQMVPHPGLVGVCCGKLVSALQSAHHKDQKQTDWDAGLLCAGHASYLATVRGMHYKHCSRRILLDISYKSHNMQEAGTPTQHCTRSWLCGPPKHGQTDHPSNSCPWNDGKSAGLTLTCCDGGGGGDGELFFFWLGAAWRHSVNGPLATSCMGAHIAAAHARR